MSGSDRRAKRGRTRRWAVLLAIPVAGVGGFMMSDVIMSPEQATVTEPPPEPVWASVEARSLSSVEEMEGTVVAGDLLSLEFNVGDTSPIVTGLPLAPGDPVQTCSPFAEISDRPAFALEGHVPPYRDLKEGDVGDDVSRLQSALRSCGYRLAVDGVFGEQTAAALRKMYADSGYAMLEEDIIVPAQGPGEGQDRDSVNTSTSPDPAAVASEPIVEVKKRAVVPASEIYFLSGDYRLTSMQPMGAEIEQELAGLTQGSLSLRVEVPPAVKSRLAEGAAATVTVGAEEFPVTVPEVPVAPEVGRAGEPVFVMNIELPIDADAGLVGTPGILSTTLGDSTVYDRVAPVTAVRTDPSGRNYVVKDVAGGEPIAVEVVVVAANGGFVALEGDVGPNDQLWLSGEG